MADILIVSSHIHHQLSDAQRQLCMAMLDSLACRYDIEEIKAGTYEIPFVINAYARKKPYHAYIALGLVLQKSVEHYNYIMNHVSTSFTAFALRNIIVGNGIISAPTVDELATKINSADACENGYASACNAVCALLSLNEKLERHRG